MVQFKAISKRAPGGRDAAQQFQEMTEEIKREALSAIAEQVAENTRSLGKGPGGAIVDTGTYARSHRVRLRSGSAAPSVSSYGKTRGVFPGPPIRAGLNQMLSDIEGLARADGNVVFFNEALHAAKVEREGWTLGDGTVLPAYRVYATTQSQAPAIINTVVQQVMARRGSA
jgi:hypothetical protein